MPLPPVGCLPTEAITLPNLVDSGKCKGQGCVTAGADGWATATNSLDNPGNSRGYIDEQVYGVHYTLEHVSFSLPPVNSTFTLPT